MFAIKSPYEKVDFPIVSAMAFKSPVSGMARPISGVTISVTSAVTSLEEAWPITNAMASPITPNFCKKSTNS